MKYSYYVYLVVFSVCFSVLTKEGVAEQDIYEPPKAIPLYIPTQYLLTIRDFQSNFTQYDDQFNPIVPASMHRGPSITLQYQSIFIPKSGEGNDQQNTLSFADKMQRAISEGISLYKIEDQLRRVPVNNKIGWYDPNGMGTIRHEFTGAPGISVIPKTKLETGWYIVEADLDKAINMDSTSAILQGKQKDNMLYTRFYIGDKPMWWRLIAQCGLHVKGVKEKQCIFNYQLTQNIDSKLYRNASKAIEVKYDGVMVQCGDVGHVSPKRENYLRALCVEPKPDTNIQVSLKSNKITDPTGSISKIINFQYNKKLFKYSYDQRHPYFEYIIEPYNNFGLM